MDQVEHTDFYWTGKMKSIEGQCCLSRKRFATIKENGVINGVEGGTEIKGYKKG